MPRRPSTQPVATRATAARRVPYQFPIDAINTPLVVGSSWECRDGNRAIVIGLADDMNDSNPVQIWHTGCGGDYHYVGLNGRINNEDWDEGDADEDILYPWVEPQRVTYSAWLNLYANGNITMHPDSAAADLEAETLGDRLECEHIQRVKLVTPA